eukprot:48005-Eustigmatos_ZCMA.PRE.1
MPSDRVSVRTGCHAREVVGEVWLYDVSYSSARCLFGRGRWSGVDVVKDANMCSNAIRLPSL